MTDKLRECPFCGQASVPGPSITEWGTGWLSVKCRACNATGPVGKTRGDVARLWNTRPFEPPGKLEFKSCLPKEEAAHAPAVESTAAPGTAPGASGLLDGECYRRALDVAIAGRPGAERGSQNVCDEAERIALERERRGGGNG
jgi:Lar family restriction alleviation protein